LVRSGVGLQATEGHLEGVANIAGEGEAEDGVEDDVGVVEGMEEVVGVDLGDGAVKALSLEGLG
jgi:hypothetical protein